MISSRAHVYCIAIALSVIPLRAEPGVAIVEGRLEYVQIRTVEQVRYERSRYVHGNRQCLVLRDATSVYGAAGQKWNSLIVCVDLERGMAGMQFLGADGVALDNRYWTKGARVVAVGVLEGPGVWCSPSKVIPGLAAAQTEKEENTLILSGQGYFEDEGLRTWAQSPIICSHGRGVFVAKEDPGGMGGSKNESSERK